MSGDVEVRNGGEGTLLPRTRLRILVPPVAGGDPRRPSRACGLGGYFVKKTVRQRQNRRVLTASVATKG